MRPRVPHRSLRRRPPTGRAVRVHIGRLVLHAVASGDAGRVAAALEAELAALAAEPGQVFIPASAARATPVHFEAPGGPGRIGRTAGAALWSAVRQSGRAEQ